MLSAEGPLPPTGPAATSAASRSASPSTSNWGETFGAWLRFGWQDQSAAVDYQAIYSGGLSIAGTPWGRPDDTIGYGYGFLDGGNQALRFTHVAEVYYRFAINEHFAVSADAQYMADILRSEEGPRGFILGLRATAEF